jgi:peptidoglycan/LPS O-acetylase OafA/YrhL
MGAYPEKETCMSDSQPPRPERLPFLDALRGVAVLLVILFHATGYGVLPYLTNPEPLLAPLCYLTSGLGRIGFLGVHLFLVLSGVSLAYRPLATGAPLDVPDFFRRRAKRILPPYWLWLVLVALACLQPNTPLAAPTVPWGIDVAAHAALIHNLFPATILSINGSFWSLGLEAQWYACFPLLLAWGRRAGWKAPLLATLLLGVLWQRAVEIWLPCQPGADVGNVWYYALPARLFEFVCGIYAAHLLTRRDPVTARRAALFFAVAFPVLAIETITEPGRYSVWTDHLWGIVFAAGVVALSAAPARVFSPAPGPARVPSLLVGLGTISYSVYLVHEPILRLFSGVVYVALAVPPAVKWCAFPLVGLLIVMTARILYGVAERPQWRQSRKAPAAMLGRRG